MHKSVYRSKLLLQQFVKFHFIFLTISKSYFISVFVFWGSFLFVNLNYLCTFLSHSIYILFNFHISGQPLYKFAFLLYSPAVSYVSKSSFLYYLFVISSTWHLFYVVSDYLVYISSIKCISCNAIIIFYVLNFIHSHIILILIFLSYVSDLFFLHYLF